MLHVRMMRKGKRENESYDHKPITVVVCARNEEQNLVEYVPKLLAQNYPKYEVLLINDRSWDETWDVMEAMSRKDDRIKLVNIPDAGKDGFAKKFALTVGIKAAKYDRLVFIDADCYPSSVNWLAKIGEKFSDHKNIVLGAGAYEREKGFLNKLIRFDTNVIALQYLSYAKAGLPYMGVGRNLGYKNELYDSVRGFKNHYHIKSGDDDLFVNEAANSKNTSVCFDSDAITLSAPEKTISDWIRQKRRHLSTGGFYKLKHKILLFMWPVSYLLLLIFGVASIITHSLWYLPAGLIGIRIVLHWMTCWRVFKIMQSKDVWVWVPLLEIFMLFLSPYLVLTNKRYNKQY